MLPMSKESTQLQIMHFPDLNKMFPHEVLGWYLVGEISFQKLQEVFQIENDADLGKLINRILSDIENSSYKDNSQVEKETTIY